MLSAAPSRPTFPAGKQARLSAATKICRRLSPAENSSFSKKNIPQCGMENSTEKQARFGGKLSRRSRFGLDYRRHCLEQDFSSWLLSALFQPVSSWDFSSRLEGAAGLAAGLAWPNLKRNRKRQKRRIIYAPGDESSDARLCL